MYFNCKLCDTNIRMNQYKLHLHEKHGLDNRIDYLLKIGYLNKCKICGKETSFHNFDIGFRKYCSSHCAVSDPEYKIQKQNTCLEKYGTITPAKSSNVKNKMKDTLAKKYSNIDILNSVNEKRKKTCLEKYGVEYTSQTNVWHNKNNDIIRDKCESITGDKFVSFDLDHRKLICKVCNNEYEIHRHLLEYRKKNEQIFCTICNKLNTTDKLQDEVSKYITSFSLDIVTNTRKIITPLELDILIPSKNIAIEFNGLNWHSEKYVENNYHQKKTEECEKQGIQLIHVYEDDWLYKQDIVKSRLKSLLGISDRRIFARKCIVKELDSKITKLFLEENHIQGGGVNSKYRYGLFLEDELVACMTFGQSRFEKDKIELHRFANKLNTNVIGGASKLFKYFLKQDISKEIISYADRSWSQGKLYETLGFSLVKKTIPNYYYIIGKMRVDRFKFRKSELIKQGFDPSKTEVEIMNNRGYFKLFDSGSLKFEYK